MRERERSKRSRESSDVYEDGMIRLRLGCNFLGGELGRGSW